MVLGDIVKLRSNEDVIKSLYVACRSFGSDMIDMPRTGGEVTFADRRHPCISSCPFVRSSCHSS